MSQWILTNSSIIFLQVFVETALNPDDAGDEDEGHRGKNHKAVVDIACVIEALRHHLIAKKRTASEKLAEETDDDKDYGVAYAIAHTVEK